MDQLQNTVGKSASDIPLLIQKTTHKFKGIPALWASQDKAEPKKMVLKDMKSNRTEMKEIKPSQ